MTDWPGGDDYAAVVHAHGAELVKLATLLVGNVHDAEDAVQDVVIACARHWPFDPPLPYLRRAVANRCIDIQRKRRDILVDEVPEPAAADPGLIASADAAAFFWMVRRLPPRQRAAVVLRYFADLDDAAIARILGISRHTVRSQIHHALAALRLQHGALAPVTKEAR